MHDHADLPFAQPFSAAPGLVVERRGLLTTVAAACAAAMLPASSSRWRDRTAPGCGFTIEEFVREVAPVCKELLADTSATGQDRYLLTLAAFAVRLTDVPVPDMRQVRAGYRLGDNHGPDPFTVLHWELQAKATIAPHAHTYGSVVTLGLAGSARICNYEVVGVVDFDTKGPIRVQRVCEQILRPGDVNLVSLERHYVHGFTAGSEGARGLDITTRLREKRKAPVLQLGDSIDAEAGVFAATWSHGG